MESHPAAQGSTYVRQIEHRDGRPNEVAFYISSGALEMVNTAISERGIATSLENLPEEYGRGYCRRLLDATRRDEARLLAHLGDVVLDSNELGKDIVSRLSREKPQDPDLFDPGYAPVDFTFRVLSNEGVLAMNNFLEDPTFENAQITEIAIASARLVASFSFVPPNLA